MVFNYEGTSEICKVCIHKYLRVPEESSGLVMDSYIPVLSKSVIFSKILLSHA